MSIPENSDVTVVELHLQRQPRGPYRRRDNGREIGCDMMNCTISDNQAGQQYGGVLSGGGGVLRMENCILWANVDTRNGLGSELAQAARNGGEIAMDYCCVQGLTGVLGGVGNIGSDPRFVDCTMGIITSAARAGDGMKAGEMDAGQRNQPVHRRRQSRPGFGR